MYTLANYPQNANGTVRVVDQDIIEADRLKGEPKSPDEAAERYRLMQAAQLIRYFAAEVD